jgi:hypothetical protein
MATGKSTRILIGPLTARDNAGDGVLYSMFTMHGVPQEAYRAYFVSDPEASDRFDLPMGREAVQILDASKAGSIDAVVEDLSAFGFAERGLPQGKVEQVHPSYRPVHLVGSPKEYDLACKVMESLRVPASQFAVHAGRETGRCPGILAAGTYVEIERESRQAYAAEGILRALGFREER